MVQLGNECISWAMSFAGLVTTLYPIIKLGFKIIDKRYDHFKNHFIEKYHREENKYKIVSKK
jgi:hypothetical protein